ASGQKPVLAPLAKEETPTDSNGEHLSEIRNSFLVILESLAPVIKGDYKIRFSELQNKISETSSFLTLGLLGEQIGKMVGELIDKAVELIAHSNDFHVELTKDLY